MSFFSSYSRSDSDCVSFFTFQVSHYNPGPTVYISHFSPFSVYMPYSMSYHVSISFSLLVSFLAIIQLLQCICLIFHVFTVSRHILGSKVSVSHFPSLLVFSPYSSSDSVCFSFFTFFKVLAIIPVLQCTFLIFHLFQCVLPYSRSYHVIFPFALFVSFLTIIQIGRASCRERVFRSV